MFFLGMLLGAALDPIVLVAAIACGLYARRLWVGAATAFCVLVAIGFGVLLALDGRPSINGMIIPGISAALIACVAWGVKRLVRKQRDAAP